MEIDGLYNTLLHNTADKTWRSDNGGYFIQAGCYNFEKKVWKTSSGFRKTLKKSYCDWPLSLGEKKSLLLICLNLVHITQNWWWCRIINAWCFTASVDAELQKQRVTKLNTITVSIVIKMGCGFPWLAHQEQWQLFELIRIHFEMLPLFFLKNLTFPQIYFEQN